MLSIKRSVTALLLCMLTNAAKYTLIPDDELLFKPCEGEEDNFLTAMFDISTLDFKFISDDEVTVNGYFTSIAPIKKDDTLWAIAEIFREVRGQYILPTVEIKRENVCESAFNPVEVWYSYTSKLAKKYQICPNVNGTVYGISNWSTKENNINLPDSKLSGGYRCIFRGGVNGNSKVHICVILDFHLFLNRL